ncbi:hypothetical protein I4641_10780 [Waterburya agarophytonicola K14]|uniref:Uncharacterized protein n=1 Tax=Waterburya agarophytonicola KI4 TaxID=2874699 RepID=A0A964FFY9_9CYAN|nr:hypothetical protein [Waterburya agarophytonicola]MCC0177461.1 hypothetical protein [Waterburya agarophytonicola KI4]
MTTSNVASAVNSSSATQSIEEVSIIIAAKDLTPTMMSQDFLKFSGIIPQEWELAQKPVLNPNYAQLNFTNGVNINAQPRSITISESLGAKKLEELYLASVASKYIEKLPHAEYVGLSCSPKILIPFPSAPENVRKYITGTLLGSGSWKNIGKAPVQAGINLMYLLDRCQLTMSISEARLQQPEKQPITAILFSGNFNYSINPQEKSKDPSAQISSFLNNWKNDFEEFQTIVNEKFLDANAQDGSNSIGETSLFPNQTL